MKITRYSIGPLVQRMDDPGWTYALGAMPTVEGVLLALEADDGTVGRGYAIGRAFLGLPLDVLEGMLRVAGDWLVDRDPRPLDDTLDGLKQFEYLAKPAMAAADCALHELAAQVQGVPLNALFGGVIHDPIPQLRIVPLKSPEEMAEKALALTAEGYRWLKLKASGDVDLDAARVSAVRAAVGPDVRFVVDANQAYDAAGGIKLAHAMADADVDIFEQPVPAADIDGLRAVAAAAPMTVEADESAVDVPSVRRLLEAEACGSVCLKVAKMGGLRVCRDAAALCDGHGIPYRFGANMGPRLLQAQGLHLAAACAGLKGACELAESEHILDDPFTGIPVSDGAIAVPEGPGSGVAYTAPAQS